MKWQERLWTVIVCLCLGFLAGWSKRPARVVEAKAQVETKEQTKVVTRTVTREAPTGHKETETLEVRTITAKERASVQVRETVEARRWSVGIYAQLAPFTDTPALTLAVDRRVWDNVSVGVYGRYRPDLTRDWEAGVGVRVDF